MDRYIFPKYPDDYKKKFDISKYTMTVAQRAVSIEWKNKKIEFFNWNTRGRPGTGLVSNYIFSIKKEKKEKRIFSRFNVLNYSNNF